ncbi:MAG: TolC family protein [Bdellovibrionales bacterium]|nr:TolC family protein [Bdellovibrionales bacterium]
MKQVVFIIQILILLAADSLFAQERISLEQFILEARSQNLTLKASASSTRAEQENAYGIRISPPQVGLIRMQMDSGSRSGFTVSQSIPFPTKISSDHAARKAMASAREEELQAREMEVTAVAKYIYFQLWEAGERLRLLNEKSKIIENHIKLARAASRSDSFLKIHVIKAENDLDLLKNNLIEAEQNVREKQIAAAEFLNQPPSTYRPMATEFPPSNIPDLKSIGEPHQLEEKRFELASMKSRESEAKSQWLPDFNIQYKEMEKSEVSPRYTEVMVGASIPFAFFWQPKAESSKATARRQAEQYLFEKEKLRIEAEKSTYMERAISLKKQLDQFTDELLPRAEKRKKIVNNLAPRDMETLQDQRETLEAFPELKLKALEVREQYEKAIMELEKFR